MNGGISFAVAADHLGRAFAAGREPRSDSGPRPSSTRNSVVFPCRLGRGVQPARPDKVEEAVLHLRRTWRKAARETGNFALAQKRDLSAAKVVDAVRPMAFNERDGRAIGDNNKAIEVSPKYAEAYNIRSRMRGPCTHSVVSD